MSKGFATASTATQDSAATASAVDVQEVQSKWLSYFEQLEDPRRAQGKLHPFLSVVMIAILATIGGASGWEDIELSAEGQAQWIETFLELPWGIPKADCYRRLFMRIEPDTLQCCFQKWVNDIVQETGGQVIPIDGKTLRGSYNRISEQSALHVVSAWASENRLMLGQMKVDSNSNEITAIPALLQLLDISGCIITIDAMGTQTDLAAQIVTQKGDYILCLKDNHPTLHQQVKESFAEDNSRIRRGHGPENFTLLRRMAISALNQETSSKRSIRQKAKLASMRPDYMTKVLASVVAQ